MAFGRLRNVTALGISGLLVVAAVAPLALSRTAHAADLTRVLVRFDRMAQNTPTTGTVCANPTSAGTEDDVQVVFPTGYTLGLAATFVVNTTNLAWPTGGTIWPGIGTATNVTSQTVTFPSTDLTPGTLYCFNWTNTAAVTTVNSASANQTGSVTTRASATPIDSSPYSTATIANDQILVTATVPQTFSFALSGNSDALGTLGTGSVTSSSSPVTATINTNAKNGWYAWARDSQTGLHSASASATIPSTTPGTNSTQVAGTPGYNTGVTATSGGGTGTATPAPAFDGTTPGDGGGLDTSLRTIATSGGTAQAHVLTLTNNVAIGVTTPAATDYTDTITVIGAGLF